MAIYVITDTSGSGKATLIRYLETLRYYASEENDTDVIGLEHYCGSLL